MIQALKRILLVFLFSIFASLLIPQTHAAANYSSIVTNDNPVSYWRLGETSGTTLNDVKNINNGSYFSNPLFGQDGAIIGDTNTSVQFNGSSSYASVPYKANLNTKPFSIEAWAYPTGGTDFRAVVASRVHPRGWVIYAQSSDAGNNWSFWLNSGNTMKQVNGPAVQLNTWTHLVGTFNGKTARLYVNGQLAASSTISNYRQNTTGPLTIGRAEATQNFFFPGKIDEISYYNKVLTATQITNHYQTGIAGSTGTPTPTLTPTTTPTASPSATITPTNSPTPTPTVTPTPTPVENLVANPSVETVAPTDPSRPDRWNRGGYGTNTRNLTYVTNDGHTGTDSVRVDITAYTDGDAKWYPDPITVTPGQTIQLSDYYKSNVSSQMYVQFELTNGSSQFVGLKFANPAAEWTWYQDSVTVPSTATTMYIFHSITSVGYLLVDDMQASIAPPETGFDRPLISITFDDSWVSHYTNAYPILQSNGLKATFYTITSWLNSGSDVMTSSQIQTLHQNGHEIASHTVTHPHLPTLTLTQIDEELLNSRTFLQNLIASPVENFATPYGEYNDTVLTEIKKYYQSHRTSVFGYNSKTNFDSNRLLVQYSYVNTTPAEIQGYIDHAKATNSWLILVYHQIDTNGGEFSTTPTTFAAQMQVVKNSDAPVLTVQQALNEVIPQIGQ